MNAEEFGLELRLFAVKKYGSLAAMGRDLGITGAYLSAVATARKRPSKMILRHMNYDRKDTITYSKT